MGKKDREELKIILKSTNTNWNALKGQQIEKKKYQVFLEKVGFTHYSYNFSMCFLSSMLDKIFPGIDKIISVNETDEKADLANEKASKIYLFLKENYDVKDFGFIKQMYGIK